MEGIGPPSFGPTTAGDPDGSRPRLRVRLRVFRIDAADAQPPLIGGTPRAPSKSRLITEKLNRIPRWNISQ